MEVLVQTLLKEIPETVSTGVLLEYTPQFVQEAQKLAIPGREKKTAVHKAFHTLIDSLLEQHKITDELAGTLNAFVDETLLTTIDLLVDAYKGQLEMPKTVEEVTQKVNCLLQFVRTILSIVKTTKAPQVTKKDAPAAATPAAATPAATV